MALILRSKLKLIFILILCCPLASYGETFFEASTSIGERQLDIFRKEADNDADDSKFIGFSLAAYRKISGRAALGGVIETMLPVNRDNDIGSGKIIGVRPIDFLYSWNPKFDTEIFVGIAQYDWIKNATGLYFGCNARYRLGQSKKLAIALEYKYFQDLAHDSGPGGDQIVDGPSLGLNLSYRFGL